MRLSDAFKYDESSPSKLSDINGVHVGALSPKSSYYTIQHSGKTLYVHRVIMELSGHSLCGHLVVDHINRNKLDNTLGNLRVVSQSINMFNTGTPSHNTSGVKGVSFDKSRNKWKAQIHVDGKNHMIGRYSTFEEACKARRQKEGL